MCHVTCTPALEFHQITHMGILVLSHACSRLLVSAQEAHTACWTGARPLPADGQARQPPDRRPRLFKTPVFLSRSPWSGLCQERTARSKAPKPLNLQSIFLSSFVQSTRRPSPHAPTSVLADWVWAFGFRSRGISAEVGVGRSSRWGAG